MYEPHTNHIPFSQFVSGSDSMLVLWDSSWTHRLWCIFDSRCVCRFGTKVLRSFMMGFNKAWGLTTNVWSLPPVLRRWSIRRFLGIFTLNIGERMPQFDLRTFFSIVVAGFRCKNNNDRMKCLGFFQLFNTPWREREREMEYWYCWISKAKHHLGKMLYISLYSLIL